MNKNQLDLKLKIESKSGSLREACCDQQSYQVAGISQRTFQNSQALFRHHKVNSSGSRWICRFTSTYVGFLFLTFFDRTPFA